MSKPIIVIISVSVAGDDFSYAPGQLVAFRKAKANRWKKRNWCIFASAEQSKTEAAKKAIIDLEAKEAAEKRVAEKKTAEQNAKDGKSSKDSKTDEDDSESEKAE